MNIAKNMEAIFVITLALISATSVATAALPARHVAPQIVADAGAPMQVVVISGKRLSAVEKAALPQ